MIPGRHGYSKDYRYGFNGKEKDDEIEGEGNSIDYGMRISDTRIGRFLSVDPLTKTFPWYTPYQFAGNTPIAAIDLDGEEPKVVITSEPTGYARVKVTGCDDDAVAEMVVRTYQLKVIYTDTQGKITELGTFNVTRDGFVDHGTSATGARMLINHSSDPQNNEKIFIKARIPEKYGKDSPAYVLTDIYSPLGPDASGYFEKGKQTASIGGEAKRKGAYAKNTMFHVIGTYKDTKGLGALGGAYGCYGLVNDEQIQKVVKPGDYVYNGPYIPSNQEMIDFDTAIQNAQKMQVLEHGKEEEKIEVEIQKRTVQKVKHTRQLTVKRVNLPKKSLRN